jgi:hypothetical protein
MVLNSHNFGRPVEVITLLFRVRVGLAEEVYQVGKYFHSDRESLDGMLHGLTVAAELLVQVERPLAPAG